MPDSSSEMSDILMRHSLRRAQDMVAAAVLKLAITLIMVNTNNTLKQIGMHYNLIALRRGPM